MENSTEECTETSFLQQQNIQLANEIDDLKDAVKCQEVELAKLDDELHLLQSENDRLEQQLVALREIVSTHLNLIPVDGHTVESVKNEELPKLVSTILAADSKRNDGKHLGEKIKMILGL